MLTIRAATETDFDGLIKIFRDFPIQPRVITHAPDGVPHVIVWRLHNTHWCVLVAVVEDSQQVVGCAVGYDSDFMGSLSETGTDGNARPRVANLEDLIVQSKYHRQGVGRRLVHAFEDWARARECVSCAVGGGPAPQFYEALGYRREGFVAAFVKKL